MITQQMTTAKAGDKPGARLTRTINTTVKIESVDEATNTVKFRRADGTVDTVTVEDPAAQQRARQLKPGDAVEVTYAEATAVDVQPVLR
jgi:translation elongation factor P/translation initiation factor 5A